MIIDLKGAQSNFNPTQFAPIFCQVVSCTYYSSDQNRCFLVLVIHEVS